MGTSVVNLHVRTDDVTRLDAALAEVPGEIRRTEPGNGWVSIYEQRASSQDSVWIAELAGRLSASADAPVVAFLVHDSDLVQVWLAEAGAVRSHVDSWPDFPDGHQTPSISGAEALADLCRDLDEDGLIELFGREVLFAEDLIVELADQLGIPSERVSVDHRDDPTLAAGTASTTDLLAALQQAMPAAEPAAPGQVELAGTRCRSS